MTKFGDVVDCTKEELPYIADKAKLGSKTSYLQNGDVIIADTAEDDTVGKATEIFNIQTPVVSGLHTMACRPRLNFESRFLGYYINSACYHNQLYPFMQGVKVTSISKGNIALTKIRYPANKEQQKIASMIALLDDRIKKQQQLIDSLKLYKRGALNSLFNRTLQFDKNATWVKKRIDEIFAERCERASGNEQLLAVTINNGVQIRDAIDKKDNSSDDKNNYKKVYKGDIAYNTMRMWQGASGCSSFDGIVSPAYTVIFPIKKEEQNIIFWSFYFKDRELIKTFQKFSQGLTSDTWNLKYTQMASIRVFVPRYSEQCKIAEFLTSFDEKINCEESRLNHLQKLKHGLLNNMFV